VTKNATTLSKKRLLSKNQLQELLLGIGLYLRDHTLSCFTDHGETPVPDHIANSKMVPTDIDPLLRVLQLLLDAFHDSIRYVSYKARSCKY
jgi:hypothetical protein